MATLIREEKYIKSDVNNNNNKWWTIQLLDDNTVITKWGRVGDVGQSKTFPGAGVGFLEKKCREKEGARNDEIPYRKLNVIAGSGAPVVTAAKPVTDSAIKDLAKKQIKTNNPIVTKLIDYLAKVNAHQISTATGGKITYNDTTGLFSTPLGIVTQENIDSANGILVEIADLVSQAKYTAKMGNLTNDFCMLVPQDIGHKRLDIKEFWADLGKVQYQKQILDNLQASLVSATTTPSKTTVVDVPEEKVFDCQLHFVEDGKEIDRIRKLYNKTRQSMHQCNHLDVKTVYSVDINTVNAAYEKDGAKMQNVWELWHGTRASNLLSILKAGLIIPPSTSAHVCGRLYGDGLYFSDMSTKSLNYAYGYWSKSGGSDNNCFMFLCSVGMGKYYKPNRSSYQSTRYPVSGYDSTFAEAGSGVYNNEQIVYRVSQARLNRLIEFSPHGK